jgi:hypothetical protein
MRINRVVVLAVLAMPVLALAQPAQQVTPGTAPPTMLKVPVKVQLLAATRDDLTALRAARQKSAGILETLNANRQQLRMSPIDMAPIDRTKVPVLFMPAGSLMKAFRVNSTRDHFVLSGGDKSVGVVLTGTRVAAPLSRPFEARPLAQSLRATFDQASAAAGSAGSIRDISVTLTEDGVDVSFTRFGALYDLRIACAKKDAPECRPDSALKLIAQSSLLGGGE